MFHQDLSPEQAQAAFNLDSPTLILAGAGSGKTRVITYRMAYLVKECGVNPYNILGVTFTNKAAKEMRERMNKLLPDLGHNMLLGTFHGLAARFLRYYGDIISLSKDFLIYDEDDSTKVIKNIINEHYDLTKEELNLLIKKILKLRNKESSLISNKSDMNILKLYYDKLAKIGALDFNLILAKFLDLLKDSSGADLITKRVRHVVVDEYQDINDIQAKIVHILAASAQTVAIVGDDDQSIYGWRGASAKFMQQFLHEFKDTKLFRLEDNYRSTRPILDCANVIISHNKDRLGKMLNSINGDGDLIRLTRQFRDIQEAGFVAEQALRLMNMHGPDFSIAVLMRINAQTRPLEEAFYKARIPYRIIGGMRFYDRKEIKDVIAAVRAILYPHSDVDLLRLVQAYPLGIGKKTIQLLLDYAYPKGLSLYETMAHPEHQTLALASPKHNAKIASLLAMFQDIRQEIIMTSSEGEHKFLRADEALIYIIDKLAIIKRLEAKDNEEVVNQLENIEQLVEAAVSFVDMQNDYDEPNDIQAFLESVALLANDEAVNEHKNNMSHITLMTLHAAKGLEFDAVFLVGLEEGILPHNRSKQGIDEEQKRQALEEERRLLYVGITRARKKLFLSFCQQRFLHGASELSLPSRFLKEIPEHTIDIHDRWLLDKIGIKNISHVFDDDIQTIKYKKTILTHPKINQQSQKSMFNIGDKVYHPNYHHGKVVGLSGDSAPRVKVKFISDGEVRTIMGSFLQRI